ncbi:MAG: TolB family protein [Minisyncoccota bacterium]
MNIRMFVCAASCIVAAVSTNASASEDLPFVENGVLYHSFVGLPEKEVVAEKVHRVLDYLPTERKLLYVTRPQTSGTDAAMGGDLVLTDTTSWIGQKIAENVISGRLSPDGTNIVVWDNRDEIFLTRHDGKFLRRIGIHGAAPVFSQDGTFVAYQKLANDSTNGNRQSLFENAYGIAVYDVRSGVERVVTNGGVDDFAPIGFSEDMSKLYFNSTRPYGKSSQNHVAAVWVVDLAHGNTKRLTNVDERAVMNGSIIPVISDDAIWSSNRMTAISSTGKNQGVWSFVFSPDGEHLSALYVSDGESPLWIIPGEEVAVRTVIDGKKVWRTVNIR